MIHYLAAEGAKEDKISGAVITAIILVLCALMWIGKR